jgi:hypothetical protein
MAAGKSTRARRSRTPAARPRASREPASTSRASLDALLAQFSEALAVAETCCRAFEAAHDRMDWTGAGSHAIALRHSVGLLQRLYTGFDLEILKVRS